MMCFRLQELTEVVKLRRAASITVIIACVSVTSFTQVSFKPAQVTSVTDAYLPYQVVYDGFVVLEVFLDGDGAIVETKALRDPGTMVPAAVASVSAWKFRPAEVAGHTLPSAMTAVFVYRPRDNGPAPIVPPKDFKPVLAQPTAHSEKDLDYVPAGIVSVVYPDYPVNSVAWGSVVVQIAVSPEGKTDIPQVLYGMAPFKDLTLKALRKWRFQPATLGGKAVLSQLTVAFIFQIPAS
jgi:Gram-negative bacterial TonB protein C-terminal